MTGEGLVSLDKETLIGLVLAQAETIAALTKQCETLLARVAELEVKLGQPPKTSENSSTSPSKGQKPSAAASAKGDGKRKSHAGAHRPLHPNPTSRRTPASIAAPMFRKDRGSPAKHTTTSKFPRSSPMLRG